MCEHGYDYMEDCPNCCWKVGEGKPECKAAESIAEMLDAPGYSSTKSRVVDIIQKANKEHYGPILKNACMVIESLAGDRNPYNIDHYCALKDELNRLEKE